MVDFERREHERIDIRMPTRMWLEETYRGKALLFEGFSTTVNLAIGGTFLESTYLLSAGFPVNLEMRISDDESLMTRGEVVHLQQADAEGLPRGMGIIFTEVDATNRERLLRFFVSDRIREFYHERFIVEFPHLESVISLQDSALVINLWEDREGRLTALHGLKKSAKPEPPRPEARPARPARPARRRR